MVDVNAPWSPSEALAAAAPLRELGLKWIEEPVWPPEDFEAAHEISASGVPVAIGENVLTPTDFARLIDGRAVDYVQPSVAKIGGISIMRDISPPPIRQRRGRAALRLFRPRPDRHRACQRRAVARADGRAALLRSHRKPVRRLVRTGRTAILRLPQGPGLGIDPDPAILDKLRVA